MKHIFLNKILKNQKGAMDKILVTLLLVVIAVGGLIGLEKWVKDQEDILKQRSENVIDDVMEEVKG
ncbi:MAG: hypothetical protein U9R16_03550 [Campylobacterota bacterium]|nr:hypothetical protein [Campylobacterota bacterium]